MSVSLQNIKQRLSSATTYISKLLEPPQFISHSKVCISISNAGFSVVHGSYIDKKFHIKLCKFVKTDLAHLFSSLANFVEEYGLENTSCIWMLNHDQYQRFTFEELPVPKEEFQSAIRWKIKDLVVFPIEDVVADSFPLPITRLPNAKRMIDVIVAKKSYLTTISEIINRSGLSMMSIDIADLGLCNILALYEQDNETNVCISTINHKIDLIFVRNQTFYLSRKLDFDIASLEVNAANDTASEKSTFQLDKLVVEIQRTLDYFQSQWRFASPTKIYFLPSNIPKTKLTSYLSQRLNLIVETMNLNDVITSDVTLDENIQENFISIIGSALRQEAKINATN